MKISKAIMNLVLPVTFLMAITTAAHAKFETYPINGTVPDRENSRPDLGQFNYTPFAEPFSERQLQALKYTAEKDTGGIHGAVARAILGENVGTLAESTVKSIEDRFAGREDCTDFTAIRTIMALYVHRDHPYLSDDHYQRLKRVLLDFKFWVDEPGYNTMIFWTENHQMVFHATEYLTGQMFPDEIFTNNGETGKWHKEHARKLLLQWIDRRSRWGFSEWDSNVYYDEDMAGIFLLAEFAEEDDMAAAATLASNLMLFDMASDLFKGIYGTSHGRTYANDVMSGWDYAVSSTLNILTGLGPIRGASSMSAAALAISTRWKPSDVIIRIGQDDPEEYTGHERHGIPLEKIKEYGISRTELNDAPTLWGMGAHSQAQVVDLFLKAADTWNLWDHPFISDAKQQASGFPRDGTVGRMRASLEIESDRTLLGEVNKLTYRTKEFMLSSAQDYRPGERANQHHIWQATLSPDAIVFTTNPGSLEIHGRTPCYWGGQNRLPRVGQHKNLAFILYNIKMQKAIGERDVFDFTHAFFPKWAFDEVREQDGWILGRAGDGYIALYSAMPYKWNDPDGEFTHDAIASGKKNIWICRMGGRSADGDFDRFADKILGAKLDVSADDLTVSFHDPDLGEASFSWKNPLVVDGNEIELNNYKRFESPYGYSEFNSGVYYIEQGGEKLILDFPKLEMRTEKVE